MALKVATRPLILYSKRHLACIEATSSIERSSCNDIPTLFHYFCIHIMPQTKLLSQNIKLYSYITKKVNFSGSRTLLLYCHWGAYTSDSIRPVLNYIVIMTVKHTDRQ